LDSKDDWDCLKETDIGIKTPNAFPMDTYGKEN